MNFSQNIFTKILFILISIQSCAQRKDIPSTSIVQSTKYSNQIKAAKEIVLDIAQAYPAVSIAVAKNGDLIWTEAFGYSNVKEKVIAQPDNLFRIYSLSKSLTGVLAARLMELGKLSLDKKVVDYLPHVPNHIKKITVYQLLNHTSGIRHYNKGEWIEISTNNCSNVDDALPIFINDPLEFDPGENYAYSSFNYVLLSAILEKAGQQPFNKLLQEHVFIPSSMELIYHDNPSKDHPKLVKFYKSQTKLAQRVNNSCKWGGGGYNATAEAITKFGNNLISNKIVKDETFKDMLAPSKLNSGEPFNYGFGLAVWEDDYGTYVSHTGSGLGGSAAMRIYPNKELVIVILGNLEEDGIKSRIGEISSIFLND